MTGYRQWSDGDLLTGADIDGYLMSQTMMRFASAAARDAALPTPVAGMQCYQTDTGLEYQYTGTYWVPKLQWFKKAGTETITSNVTPQNDDDFVVPMPAGSYRVEAFLHCGGAAAGDIRTKWTFSGTISTSARSCFGLAETATAAEDGNARTSGHGFGTEIVYGIDATTTTVVHEDLFIVATVGGTLVLQWAQGTSSGTGTTLSVASRVYVTKLA